MFLVIPVNINLVVTSLCLITIGSVRSIKLTPIVHEQNAMLAKASDLPIEKRETLSAHDAYMFPVFGSMSLFGLYCAFKYLDPYYVNLLLSAYFTLAGIGALTATFAGIMKNLLDIKHSLLSPVIDTKFVVSIPYVSSDNVEDNTISVYITTLDILSLIPSSILTYYYMTTKHYMLNNIIGYCFCIQAIENISIGSYKIGAILLTGLFFYDIFWVFGTEVMVSVAKSVKGPLLLQFPRVLAVMDSVTGEVITKAEFSMLGLGDIVVPGFFISLLLRLDTTIFLKDLQNKQTQKIENEAKTDTKMVSVPSSPVTRSMRKKVESIDNSTKATTSDVSADIDDPTKKHVSLIGLDMNSLYTKDFSKPYFYGVMLGYAVGLFITVAVMMFFNAAQPALLYLVPCCLLFSMSVGLYRNEFLTVTWLYNEEEEEVKKE